MFEELEKEGAVEAAAIAAHPSNISIPRIQYIKAQLELVRFVLFLEYAEVHHLTNVRHAIIHSLSNLGFVVCISIILLYLLVDSLLLCSKFFIGWSGSGSATCLFL